MFTVVTKFLVLPSKAASCVRSFSELCSLKTYMYLRSCTVAQDRLNSATLATVHTDLIDKINVTAVTRDFAGLNRPNARRKHNCMALLCES